jgi:hypothetical protein
MVKTLKVLLQINKVEHTRLLTKNTLALEAWQVASNKSNVLRCQKITLFYQVEFMKNGNPLPSLNPLPFMSIVKLTNLKFFQ